MSVADRGKCPAQEVAMSPLLARSVSQVEVRRISPGDTNYFALLFDPAADAIEPVCVIEIFEIGGATPPNAHVRAHEFFYVLSGQGIARCGELSRPIAKGDAIMLRPGAQHVIQNVGNSKLYTLTLMLPDEGFAAMILAGEPCELDAEDRAVLLETAR